MATKKKTAAQIANQAGQAARQAAVESKAGITTKVGVTSPSVPTAAPAAQSTPKPSQSSAPVTRTPSVAPSVSTAPAAQNFYKVGGSYYREDGSKILNPTDLSAAAKAGGKEISAPGATPTPTAAAAGTSYSIKPGDTLSAIARNSGTTVDALMKLNPGITNPNLIYAGKSLTLPGATAPTISDASTTAEANAAINADQDADIAGATTALAELPPVKTTAELMADIKKTIEPTVAAPSLPNYTKTLSELRNSYGVTDAENSLNALRAQEADLLAASAAQQYAETQKTVPMNVISGRISEEEAQAAFRLRAVQNSIQSVTDQLNTKYNIIDTMMKTSEMDYNAATTAYDKQMATNIQLYNAAKNIEDEQKSDIEKAQDTARSNAQILINAYAASGTQYDSLSSTQKTELAKLGTQSGLGVDIFSTILSAAPAKEILTSIKSDNGTQLSIIYKDGTSAVINTGLAPQRVTGSGSRSGGGAPSTVTSTSTVGDLYNMDTVSDRSAIAKAATSAGMTMDAFLKLPIDEGNKYLYPDEDSAKVDDLKQGYQNQVDVLLSQGKDAAEIKTMIQSAAAENGDSLELQNGAIDYLKEQAKLRDQDKWKLGEYVGSDI